MQELMRERAINIEKCRNKIVLEIKNRRLLMKRLFCVILTVFLVLLATEAVFASNEPNEEQQEHSFGAGIGISYGNGLGVNVNNNIAPNLDFTGSLGYNLYTDFGYEVGLKYYLAPVDQRFRPKVFILYGSNSFAYEKANVSSPLPTIKSKNYQGVTIGIGGVVYWKKSHDNGGLDFDITYIVSSDIDKEKMNAQGYDIYGPGSFDMSIGYRWDF